MVAAARLHNLLMPLGQNRVTLQLISAMVFLRGLKPSMRDFVTREYGRSTTPILDDSIARATNEEAAQQLTRDRPKANSVKAPTTDR